MSIRKQSTCVNRAVVAFLAVAVLFIGATTASAQLASKKTTVTFTEPVEIPGVDARVRPAGVYVFRLLDSLSDRHIVQVFNKDESHIYATILAIPNYRLRATDKTVMTFAERAAGDPRARGSGSALGSTRATTGARISCTRRSVRCSGRR